MTNIIRYDAAVKALAECRAVDEVKEWADKAAAMQAYGRMAKDKTLEVDAAEIRIRAERRLGELMAQQRVGAGLNKGAATRVAEKPASPPTLADAGIDKNLADRARKLAAVPKDEFEADLAAKRQRDQAEGARVSAKLQARGEAAMAQREEEPESYGPDEAEIAAIREAAAANEAMLAKILDADDKAAAILEENKRLNAELAVVKGQRDQYMNKCNELIRRVKALNKDRAAA